ncbi:uncharacterized protein LOC131427268 [Malaya genurostris]|uniref:uncharacterized protein LOC131427268 n=1 Tax=Malaya genurostris TaxID=325434 RepID=UPI0026F3FDE9|nr:uncharacterized protein LOC131427268 [Malaya genurostris]
MEWLITICLVTKQENNPFAHELTKALSTRLENLRTSMAFKMAIYLDPRFNYTNSNVFNGDEKEHIQKFIIQTWARIKSLDPRYSIIEQTCTTNATEAFNESDNFITEIFGGSLSTTDTSSTFQQQLKTLQAELRQCTTYDAWDHWMKRKTTHPELYAVASVVLAVPATQSTVERSFSALALILSPHRSTLGEDILEHILLVKLNKTIYEKTIATVSNLNITLQETGNPDSQSSV